ncbi:MAG: hypothetical protein LBT76_03940, partial [Tannerella sp.]|nr:hypothetical protein [Tannerella sp.]
GNNGCIPDGMPGKAGAMRFYRAIFPTGMGQSANNLLQVIHFTLLKGLKDGQDYIAVTGSVIRVIPKSWKSCSDNVKG